MARPVALLPAALWMPIAPVVGRTVTGPLFQMVAVPVIRSLCVPSETCRTESADRSDRALVRAPATEAPAPRETLVSITQDRKSALAPIGTTRSHRARGFSTRGRSGSDRVAFVFVLINIVMRVRPPGADGVFVPPTQAT